MGGRGASSRGYKNYGSEFLTIHTYRNIRFIRSINGNAKSPIETQAKGHIYGLINNRDELVSLTFYDRKKKHWKQLDVQHAHSIDGVKRKPHVHFGYTHNERGDGKLSILDYKILALARKAWDNKNK